MFKQTPEAAGFVEALQRLQCPVAGAVFIQKISPKPAATEQMPKKRAKAPDLSDTQPKKVAKSKAKGKAKAKAAPAVLPTQTEAELAGDVKFEVGPADGADDLPAGARRRLWLDDLLAAIGVCHRVVPADSTNTALMTSHLLSLGLEFALTTSVRLHGANSKALKDWSKAPGTMWRILRFFRIRMTIGSC